MNNGAIFGPVLRTINDTLVICMLMENIFCSNLFLLSSLTRRLKMMSCDLCHSNMNDPYLLTWFGHTCAVNIAAEKQTGYVDGKMQSLSANISH